ncbi:MAG: hypothetical protein HOK71_11545 [Planctomycetaceae bacterium]|jgi:hypothetical protein|nr:hypothetical protein [Planctomycetaceae bacterium]
MNDDIFRFEFEPDVPLMDPEMSLHLAMFAAEGLFGRARVRLEAEYTIDEPHQAIVVDGSTEVGSLIVRVFTGLLFREYGEDAFRVERITSSTHQPDPEQELCPHEAA